MGTHGKLLNLGYDGYVCKPDKHDGYLEICILQPDKSINLLREINTKTFEHIISYPTLIDDILLSTYIQSTKTIENLKVVTGENYYECVLKFL